MSPAVSGNRVFSASGSVDWSELAKGGEAWLAELGVSDFATPLACVVASPREALAVAAAAYSRCIDVAILGRERFTLELERLILSSGLTVAGSVGRSKAVARSEPGRVWIPTSGTTGQPKLVQHTWETLLTVSGSLAPRRWLLPYQPGTYAWYQLVVPSIRIAGQDLIVAPYGDVHAAIRAAADHEADAISSTPTFWRVALMNADPADMSRLRLKQISLGGEVVDQAILDTLRQLFPDARISHVYAATEVGACAVVHDGLAGLPTHLFSSRQPSARLRVDDGRLWVRSGKSAGSALPESAGWIDTGDLVEECGDRVHFRGRSGRPFINVGGQKVFPGDVEAVLLKHSGVRWCRIEARRAPVVGYLLTAKVLLGVPRSVEIETQLSAHCRAYLPEYGVPRFFEFVEEIPMGGNLKSAI